MNVIDPTFITDAILTSSSVAEPEAGYTAYNPASSYADKAHVWVAATHRRYEAIGALTAGFYPPDHPEKWLVLGSTNRWAMFDQAAGSRTTDTGQIEVVLTPGRINSVALLDLDAKQVTVDVHVSGVLKYTRTQVTAVGGVPIDNWYDWFFAPIGTRTTLLFDDLPAYRNSVVTVTIDATGSGETVSCGTLLIGSMFDLGTTLSGVDIGIDDFSSKTRDQFGTRTIVERPYVDTVSYQIAMPSARVDAVKTTLASFRATPTLYIGNKTIDSTFTYGTWRSFRINLARLTGMSNLSLDVESL